MKNKTYILFACLASLTSQAQENDSIRIPDFMEPTVLKNIQWNSPIQASRLNFQNYTQSGIQTNFANQNIKRTQTADEINNYQFITEGLYNFDNKLRVFGSFKYDNEIEKGLAYNLSSHRTNTSKVLKPNYYYSPSKGNWNNQKYNLVAGTSYEVVNNLFLGAVIHYDNFNFNRNSDPRPKNYGSDIDYKLQLGYQFKKHLVSVNYFQNIRKEENNIYYENKTLNAATNPDYYIRYSSGYGYNIYNSFYSVYLDKTIVNGFGFDYSFKDLNNYFSLGYNYSKGKKNYFISNSNGGNTRPIESDEFIKFSQTQNNHAVDAYYKHFGNSLPVEIMFSYNRDRWVNYVKESNSSNSYNTENDFFLQTTTTLNNSWVKSVGAKVNYNQIDVKDLFGITEKHNATLDFTIFAQKNLIFKNQTFYTHLGLGLITPTSNSLNYSPVSQDQDFANNVILKDNVYDNMTKWKGEVILGYDLPVKNGNIVRFKGHYQFINGQSNEVEKELLMKGTSHSYGLGVSILY